MTSIFFEVVRTCRNQIQIQLSRKQRTLSKFVGPFLKSPSNLSISKKKTAKNIVRQLSNEVHFGTPFDSQHVKGSQTLVEFAWTHFYHIFHHSWGH